MIQVHQFDPLIYPFKFWIVVNKTPFVLSEHFTEYNGSEIVFTETDGSIDRTNAFVMKVKHKETRCYGAVLYFTSKSIMSPGIMAHEASHAAKDLFTHIGADINPHEPFEYLLEFIVDCCEQVRKNKFKNE